MKSWYSRNYLGKEFAIFLESDMKRIDFLRLQSALESVSVQLQELNSFIENGFQNKTGKIHTSLNVERER